MAIKKDFKPS